MTRVQVVEVSARDGLQNDPAFLTTEQKVELIRRSIAAGIDRAEVASFANPKAVPQMADAEGVLEGLGVIDGFSSIGLVLNTRGFHRAVTTNVKEVNVVVVSTDTFSQRNQRMDSLGTLAVLEEVIPLAREAGIKATVTLAASFGCPFEGEVSIDRTVMLAEKAAEYGVAEIALADTIGVAVPADVKRRFEAVKRVSGDIPLRAHFHNTRNTGYANALAAVEAGVFILDASLAGIGGCPFAPKATGNIATEDLVYALHRSGIETGIDLDKLLEASEWFAQILDRKTPSLVSKAGVFPPAELLA